MKDTNTIDSHPGNISLAGRPDSLKNSPVGNFKYAGAPSPLYSETLSEPDTPAPPPPPPVWSNEYSLELDGTNTFISAGSVGDTYYDLGTNDFSFSFWLKLNSLDAPFTGVFGMSQSGTGYNAYLARNGNFAFYNAPTLHQNLSAGLSLDEWYHVAFVRNSGTLTVYVNGTGGLTPSVSSLNFDSSSSVRIGNDNNDSFPPIDGLIDEFALWKNHALTTSEISNLRGGASSGTLGEPVDISSIGTDNSGNSGPDNWWRMGDNDGGTGTTITDQGSGGKDGELINSPTFSTDVPTLPPAWEGNEYSVEFDGTDDYMAVNQTDLASAPMSFSAWIKLSSVSVSKAPIIGDENQNSFLYFNPTNGYFYLRDLASNDRNTRAAWSGTPTTNTWHHFMLTYDGSGSINSVNIYIDGSLVSTLTGFGIAGFRYDQIARQGAGVYFPGKMDEVAVFDSDQTSNVSAIYNSGIPDDLSPYSPKSWWRMGENNGASGTTITDQGSDGNDGTLTNSPTFSTDIP